MIKVSIFSGLFIFLQRYNKIFNYSYYIYIINCNQNKNDMDKLTRQQEVIVRKLLHYSKSEEFSQFILKTIEEHNWTRDILGDTVEFLTEEQEDLYESLGGGYDSEEIDEFIYNNNVNLEISRKLREQGVTKYLCENEEYLDEIRNGSIICEGINVEEIKNMVME